MKALTLWQPWASLVALGHKKVETRCWSTDYRGPLAIHSARRIPPEWLGSSRLGQAFKCELREVFNTTLQCQMERKVYELPRGCVLCIVNLVDVRETTGVYDDISQRERIFGNYEEGRYAWFLNSVQKFDIPIPVKGNRRLWNWNR